MELLARPSVIRGKAMNKVVAMLAAIVAVSASFGQIFGGQVVTGPKPGLMAGGPMTALLMDPKVSDELKLTDDQKNKLDDIGRGVQSDMIQAFQDAKGDQDKQRQLGTAVMDKATKSRMDVLTADQQKRLEEIYIQDNGTSSVLNKTVQKDLGLLPDQTKKISTLLDSLTTAMMQMGQKLQNQEIDFQKFQDLSQKNTKILTDELAKILTDDQKKQLKTMEGKAFKRDSQGG
jgi:ribosomal protein L16 Arg81 hydroxylase